MIKQILKADRRSQSFSQEATEGTECLAEEAEPPPGASALRSHCYTVVASSGLTPLVCALVLYRRWRDNESLHDVVYRRTAYNMNVGKSVQGITNNESAFAPFHPNIFAYSTVR